MEMPNRVFHTLYYKHYQYAMSKEAQQALANEEMNDQMEDAMSGSPG